MRTRTSWRLSRPHLPALGLAIVVAWLSGGTPARAAIQLDGFNDHVRVGNFSVSGRRITLSAWFYWDRRDRDPRLLSKSFGTATNQAFWQLAINDVNGTFGRLRFRLHAGGFATTLEGPPNVTYDEWVFVAGVYDGTNMILYRDGVQIATTAKNGDIRVGGAQVWIGDDPAGTGSREFPGRITDVRIYRRDLSADEIGSLYQLRGADGIVLNLVSRWPLREAAPGQAAPIGANLIRDHGPAGNHGTVNSNPTHESSPLVERRRPSGPRAR